MRASQSRVANTTTNLYLAKDNFEVYLGGGTRKYTLML
jgi:hypothetical protein